MYAPFGLSLPTYVPVECLVFNILHQVQFYLYFGFLIPISARTNSIPVFSTGDTLLLLLLALALLFSQFFSPHQQAIAKSCWFPVSPSCFLIPSDGELLHSQKEQPALFFSFVSKDFFPGDFIQQFLRKPQIRSLEVQGPDSTLCLAHIPQDCELSQGMITTAQAASNLNIFDDLLHTGENHV